MPAIPARGPLATAGDEHLRPVAWTQGTPVGGIGPRRATDIRLVGEELRLRITDLDHYAVTARYKLDNPGPERTVTYGVPVAHVPLGRDSGSVTRKAALADSVHLHIGDQSFRCEVTDVARGPYLDDEARLSVDESPKYFDAGDGTSVPARTLLNPNVRSPSNIASPRLRRPAANGRSTLARRPHWRSGARIV